MNNVLAVTNGNFQAEVLEAKVPVLVDLYADWCMPCRMLGQVLAQMASKLDGQVKFVKINVDEQAELAGAFGVSGIPMLVLFQDGQVVDHAVGALTAGQVGAMLEKARSAALKLEGTVP